MYTVLKLYMINRLKPRYLKKIRFWWHKWIDNFSKYCPSCILPQNFVLIKSKNNPQNRTINIMDSRWLNAHSAYKNGYSPEIKLVWYDNPKHENFGDWLSPYLINKVSKQTVIHIPDYENYDKAHIVGIGSIASAINQYSHVLGSGIASLNEDININAHFHFIRGPYTRQRIIDQGGPKVEQMGDMGYMVSRVYKPIGLQKEIDILFVRHIAHQSLNLILPDSAVEYSINASDPKSIEELINNIVRAKIVVTSALHCFIVCKSYNVPVALVNFKNSLQAVPGDGVKYKDALEGVNLKPVMPFDLPLNMSRFNFENIVDLQDLEATVLDEMCVNVSSAIQRYNQSQFI